MKLTLSQSSFFFFFLLKQPIVYKNTRIIFHIWIKNEKHKGSFYTQIQLTKKIIIRYYIFKYDLKYKIINSESDKHPHWDQLFPLILSIWM